VVGSVMDGPDRCGNALHFGNDERYLLRPAHQRGDSRFCARVLSGHDHCLTLAMPNRKTGSKGTRKASDTRRYGEKASEKVERSMHEMKRGELRSGGSGKKVTNTKQAIAIGLSEARRAGGKVPSASPKARNKKPTPRKKAAA
jgi:hypothetical protein